MPASPVSRPTAQYGATELATSATTGLRAPAEAVLEDTGHRRSVSPFQVAPKACYNKIHTSKYRWYTFVPLNLYEQFHNLANVYFLIIALLQTISSISITSGRPLLLAPLSFVLAVAAIRDLVEDRQRKAADKAENDRPASRIVDESGRQETLRWRDVRPGHVLRLHQGELIPADGVLLNSSDPSKSCSVETANLDGETNHKRKAPVLPAGLDYQSAHQHVVEFEAPHADLYRFQGALHRDGSDGPVGLSAHNLLLRGSSVQEVEWADCLVCYAGHDTRVMKNSQGARFKASQLDVEMNFVIKIIFVVQLILCCTGGFMYAMWDALYYPQAWYLMPRGRADDQAEPTYFWKSFYLKAATWLLQLNNMVPISLIVMMTTVKYLQGKLVETDEECFDEKTRKHAEVHTSQVLESLGMISHVFSDKTGTLTCNEMVYKACVVGDRAFGLEGYSPKMEAQQLPAMRDSHVDFEQGGRAFLAALESESTQMTIEMANFLLCQALCHSVNVQGGGEYAGPSPDELALVEAARAVGLAFAGRPQQHLCELRVSELSGEPLARAVAAAAGASPQRSLRLEILDVCEFDNDRKRMSVVVRYPDGRAVLLLKGADSSVLPFVEPARRGGASERLREFAALGLRTLCLAARDLPEAEYSAWAARYRAAGASLSSDRASQVQQLASELETARGLGLLGVTAIEDRLQEGVPETLERLHGAGVVVWVLTGDKMETAISIGRSCRLLREGVENIEVSGDGPEGVEMLRSASLRPPPPEGRAVTIAGDSLARVLADEDLRRLFHRVSTGCKTVICCRASPKQKADVVRLVQELDSSGPVTLAIGDGANDVSMITAANVGVGLSGNEGAQAARAADFAIGQFRFLQRLLLVHGRESYRKNAIVVSYNFYKNSVLVLPSFLYGFAMAFSGQPFYEQILYQVYNVLFTFWPVVFYAILDRSTPDLAALQEEPSSYAKGRCRQYFNSKVFMLWIGAALLQGCLLTVAGIYSFSDGGRAAGSLPTLDNMWLIGTAVYFWVVLGVNLTLLGRLKLIVPATVIVTIACAMSFPFCTLILDVFGSVYISGVFALLFGTLNARFILVSVPLMLAFLMIGEPLIIMSESASVTEPRAPLAEPLLGNGGRRRDVCTRASGLA